MRSGVQRVRCFPRTLYRIARIYHRKITLKNFYACIEARFFFSNGSHEIKWANLVQITAEVVNLHSSNLILKRV